MIQSQLPRLHEWIRQVMQLKLTKKKTMSSKVYLRLCLIPHSESNSDEEDGNLEDNVIIEDVIVEDVREEDDVDDDVIPDPEAAQPHVLGRGTRQKKQPDNYVPAFKIRGQKNSEGVSNLSYRGQK